MSFLKKNKQCSQNEGEKFKDRYSKMEKMGILAAVAKDTDGKVCAELITMLGLTLNDPLVAEVIKDNAIEIYYDSISDIPASTNLKKDQEYALIAGLQLEIEPDYCMYNLQKHYHRQQAMKIRNYIPLMERRYLDEITDEMIFETAKLRFDLTRNNAFVAFMNITNPGKTYREYSVKEYQNGIIISEERHLLTLKVKRFYTEHGYDLDSIGDDQIMECIHALGKDSVKVRKEIMEITRDLIMEEVPLVNSEGVDAFEVNEIDPAGNAAFAASAISSPENRVVNSMLISYVYDLLDSRSDEEKAILSYRFGLKCKERLTRNEIAAELGMEYKEVQNIERRALNALYKKIMSQAPEVKDLIYGMGLSN